MAEDGRLELETLRARSLMLRTRLLTCILLAGASICGRPLAAQTPDFNKARDEVLQTLQALIRIDTSNPPGNETPVAQYLKGILDREGIASEIVAMQPGRANLIARLKGSGKAKPILLMGHEDVVPVVREKWTVEPFAGIIKDGYIYGRGSRDDKSGLAAMLQVFLMVHRQKLPLDRDIILLAEAAEETGEPAGISYVVSQHWPKIEAEFALNEGGETHIRNGRVDYVGVQTGEKSPRGIKLVARGTPGHGSRPRMDNAVVHLAAALEKIGNYQPPMRLNETTRVFFQRLAKISPPDEAFIFSHLEDPNVGAEVQEKLRRSNNATLIAYNSMLRTSISPNVVKAGMKENVIPGEAEALLDVRLAPGDTREDVIAELRRIISDPAVEVLAHEWTGTPASPVSRMDSPMFHALEQAQAKVFPSAVTLPQMSTVYTDSALLRSRGVQAYGIGPAGTDEDSEGVHGNDERVSVDAMGTFVEFLYRAVVSVAGRN
jgi:acetylornithine deacetylase/succinyl-diaminopimelate desuccinylase-like protein